MKKIILNYHLEIYTIFVLFIAILGFFNVYDFTNTRKILLTVISIGLVHEYEEKRFPGGFFETLGKTWGWDMENTDFRKPGQWVILVWLIIGFIPYIFDTIPGLVLAPMFLGIFEMIIHTAGKKICHIKGWYVPGIVTGWMMGIVSIYNIYRIHNIYKITFTDYALGILCVILIMIFLQCCVQHSANYSIKKMISHMKQSLTSKK